MYNDEEYKLIKSAKNVLIKPIDFNCKSMFAYRHLPITIKIFTC